MAQFEDSYGADTEKENQILINAVKSSNRLTAELFHQSQLQTQQIFQQFQQQSQLSQQQFQQQNSQMMDFMFSMKLSFKILVAKKNN
ncbi:hypothetical protein H7Y21_00970 [Arenimonas sp.]|nr:hypothetical protein [Candidatus Parcubacteria bacterium]